MRLLLLLPGRELWLRALHTVIAMRRWIEVGATVALLVGSAWLGQLVYHNNWGHVAQAATPTTFPEEIVARTPSGTPTVVQRDRLGDKAVFLVLSADCRYCKENGPNWKALVEEIGGDAGSCRGACFSRS